MNRQDEHFESDAQLAALEAELRRAMRVAPPDGLAQRLADVTTGPLDADLRGALTVAAPAGLADRIMAACAQHRPAPAVVGRIGWMPGWAIGLAAMFVLVGGPLWHVLTHSTSTSHRPGNPALIVASIDERLRRMEAAMSGPIDAIDAQIAALAIEVDQAAWSIQHASSIDDMMDDTAHQLNWELESIEERLGAF
jgi:hypothetical protein